MASADLHLEIGEQYVEAAREVVEKAIAPFRNVGEHRIGSDSIDDSGHWVYVTHDLCGADIYSGQGERYCLEVQQLLKLIAEHKCEIKTWHRQEASDA